MRLDKLLLIGIFLALPFDSSDYLNFKVANLNVGAVDILVVVVFFIVVQKQMVRQAPLSLTPDLLILLLLTITISLPCIAWSSQPTLDLKMTFNFIEYLVIFYVFSQIIRDGDFLRTILRVFIFVSSCLASYTIITSLGLLIPSLTRGQQIGSFLSLRIGVVGFVKQFAPFSLLIVGAFPLIFANSLIKRQWLKVGLTFLLMIASIVTSARGLYVALAIQIIALFYIGHFRSLPQKKKIIFVVIYMMGTTILIIFIFPLILMLEAMRQSTITHRIETYILGLKILISNPHYFLFGFSEGSFVSLNRIMIHNFMLDVLVTKGVLTFVAFISLLFRILFRLLSIPGGQRTIPGQLRTCLLIGFIGMVIVGMFDVTTTSIVFWVYLSTIYAFTLIFWRRNTELHLMRTQVNSRIRI